MNIVVLLKCPVKEPDSKQTLSGLDPGDTAALTTALNLARGADDSLVAVTAGSKIHEAALTRALRLGMNRAIRVSDPALDDGDANTVASVLATGIRTLDFDLIIAGNRSSDWGSGATGPAVAHFLDIPHITAVIDIQPHDESILVTHKRELNLYTLRIKLPALVTVSAGASIVLEEKQGVLSPETMELADMTLPRVAQPQIASSGTIKEADHHTPASIDDVDSLVQLLNNSGPFC